MSNEELNVIRNDIQELKVAVEDLKATITYINYKLAELEKRTASHKKIVPNKENKKMKNIYLAAPFFNDEQKENLNKVVKALKENHTIGNIFLPGNYQHEEIEFGSKEWKSVVFEQDVTNIDNCDVVVAIANFIKNNDEIIPDPGTTWEMGYAKGINKPVILVDVSDNWLTSSFEDYAEYFTLNLMVDMGTQAHLTLDELEEFDFNNIIISRKDWRAV